MTPSLPASPRPGQGGGRREQLSDDWSKVMRARADEIRQLRDAGKTLGEISAHLDRTDPSREAQHEPEAGRGRRVRMVREVTGGQAPAVADALRDLEREDDEILRAVVATDPEALAGLLDALYVVTCRDTQDKGQNPGTEGALGKHRGGARSLASVVEKAGESVSKLAPAGDAELAVDAAEVGGGGLGGDEQQLGDLPVGVACGCQPGHPQLAGGQRVAAGDRAPGAARRWR